MKTAVLRAVSHDLRSPLMAILTSASALAREDLELGREDRSELAMTGRAYVGTSAHGNGGRYSYYACSTRYKYGPDKCDGDRLPKGPARPVGCESARPIPAAGGRGSAQA